MYPSDKHLKSVCGLVKPLQLELSISQINLISRPVVKRINFRSGIKRPMSATPQLGYKDHSIINRSPSWSRPQSADNCCSGMMRRSSKLAAKFSSLDTNSSSDLDYIDRNDCTGPFGDLKAMHMISSSLSSTKLLHNLIGSSSLDDISITPSPSPTEIFHICTKSSDIQQSIREASAINDCETKPGTVAIASSADVVNDKKQSEVVNHDSKLDESCVSYNKSVSPNSVTTGDCNVEDGSTSKNLLFQSLEPGLASKPPLPPTPDLKNSKINALNQPYNNNNNSNNINNNDNTMDEDEIVNFKFQRWFPDSVMNYNKGYNETKVNKREDINKLMKSQIATGNKTEIRELDVLSPLGGSFCYSINDINKAFGGYDEVSSDDMQLESVKDSDHLNKENRCFKDESISRFQYGNVISDCKLSLESNNDNMITREKDSGKESLESDNAKYDWLSPSSFKSNHDDNKSLSIPSKNVTQNSKIVSQTINNSHKIKKKPKGSIIKTNERQYFKKKTTTLQVPTEGKVISDKKQRFKKHINAEDLIQSNNNNNNNTISNDSGPVDVNYGTTLNFDNCKINNNRKTNDLNFTEDNLYNSVVESKASSLSINKHLHNKNNSTLLELESKLQQSIETTNKYVNLISDIHHNRITNHKSDITTDYCTSDYDYIVNGMINNNEDNFVHNFSDSSSTLMNKGEHENITDNNSNSHELDESKNEEANVASSVNLKTLPSITITDESESATKEGQIEYNNDNSSTNNLLPNIDIDNNSENVISPSNNQNRESTTEFNTVECFRNTVPTENDSTVSEDESIYSKMNVHKEDNNSCVKKLIKTRLALSSEYIIQTINPNNTYAKLNYSNDPNVIINTDFMEFASGNSKVSDDCKLALTNNSENNNGASNNNSLIRDDKKMMEIHNLLPLPQMSNQLPVEVPERDKCGDRLDVVNSTRDFYNNVDFNSSTYDDIVNILKILEREEQADSNLMELYNTEKGVNGIDVQHSTSTELSTSSVENGYYINKRNNVRMAILNFLDESDQKCDSALNIKTATVCTASPSLMNTNRLSMDTSLPVKADLDSTKINFINCNGNRLAELMLLSAPELAQQVVSLQIVIEQKNAEHSTLNEELENIKKFFEIHKKDTKAAIQRHQSFIDQLLNEKKRLTDQCSSIVKEMDEKHKNIIKTLEEKHKVELKKACDKTAAAEKVKREKWIDMKTKRIKELTVKGLEPELTRMASIHQDELAEMRRAHQRQLEEIEAACNRRLASARTEADTERERAVSQERDTARTRLEQEIMQLEKSYQEQRRRLLAEVRSEREQLQKENSMSIAEKESQLQHKLDKISQDTHEKLGQQEKQFQAELERMKGVLEAEKEAWMSRQKGEFSEHEKVFREECKKERDRHIDILIKKFEAEASSREQMAQSKLRKEKEQFESEIKDMENVQREMRQKLKDARTEANLSEEKNVQLLSQINKLQTEYDCLKQAVQRLMDEKHEIRQNMEDEMKQQLEILKRELAQTRLSMREQIINVQTDKEKELQQVYSRIKEVMTKKDETIALIEKQRDAALDQCNQLEKLLQMQHQNKKVVSVHNQRKGM